MVSSAPIERILLIGDADRKMSDALATALPSANVISVCNYFDAIAEMTRGSFTAVMAAAEPIERRPEPAVRALRQLAGESRVLLFGHPTLEPLSRKMLHFGCDDYIVTPASGAELAQMFGTPPLRLSTESSGNGSEPLSVSSPTRITQLMGLPLAEMALDAIVQHPGDGPMDFVAQINRRIGPAMQLALATSEPSATPEGSVAISAAIRSSETDTRQLHLVLPRDEDETAARHFLSQIAQLVAKMVTIRNRHHNMLKQAFTDELTGLFNRRFFDNFLANKIEQARAQRFPVTLALFDIDNFKHYNDEYGHSMGDTILKQTASLMRSCCRAHDLVARISGDEFAVIFWEKEGPRTPKDAKSASANTFGKLAQTPYQIVERVRNLVASKKFEGLGPGGPGSLTISTGMAVFPYEANNPRDLYLEADKALMQGAKRGGKNTIYLVGGKEWEAGA